MRIKFPYDPTGTAGCGRIADIFKCEQCGQEQEAAVKVVRTNSKSELRETTRVSYCRPFVPLYVIVRLP